MKRLFMDLETYANLDAVQFMPEPEAPGNLKDPEKIRAALEAKRQEQIDRAALDPDYGEIVTIGYAITSTGPIAVLTGDEAKMLREFWKAYDDCDGRCVGYNILGFDLPYLMRRSMAYGIQVPFINLAKFRTEPVTDLMGILYNWGQAKSLKLVARLYGLPVECPDRDGSQVGSMTLDEIKAYQVSDVKLTIALWAKMNGVYFSQS